MYEETDRCPNCGHYAGDPVYGRDDDFPYSGSGASLMRLPIYTMTGGRLRFVEDPYNIILTVERYNEADYRR